MIPSQAGMSVQLPGAPSSGGEGLLAGNEGVRNGELLVVTGKKMEQGGNLSAVEGGTGENDQHVWKVV